jgi:hypothetical protein
LELTRCFWRASSYTINTKINHRIDFIYAYYASFSKYYKTNSHNTIYTSSSLNTRAKWIKHINTYRKDTGSTNDANSHTCNASNTVDTINTHYRSSNSTKNTSHAQHDTGDANNTINTE